MISNPGLCKYLEEEDTNIKLHIVFILGPRNEVIGLTDNYYLLESILIQHVKCLIQCCEVVYCASIGDPVI